MPRRAIWLMLAVVAITACGGGPSRSPLLSEGRDLYRDNACSTCHGGGGRGGVGPSLHNVAEVFPACDDQVEWVKLGSDGWKDRYGETYGATDKKLKGGMRSFADEMTDEEIRKVIAYERIEFGELDEAAVRADCGFPPAPGTPTQ